MTATRAGRVWTGATWTGKAWSCAVRLVLADERALRPATDDLVALLATVDAAASRFRPDSELSRANARAGVPTPISGLLAELVSAALDAAVATDGAVDPTLGATLRRLGYDRDIALLGAAATDGHSAGHSADTDQTRPGPASAGRGWGRVRLDRRADLLTVPVGVELDLGATAKAWTADFAARTIAARYGVPTLVELGGDLAVAGPCADGWRVRVAERSHGPGQVVTIRHGGLATSTTTLRAWSRDGQLRNHLIDPRTSQPVDGPWRTASVWAATSLEANIASTAALVLGADALGWLTQRGFAARLVGRAGDVTTTVGWPRTTEQAAADGGDPSADHALRSWGRDGACSLPRRPASLIIAGTRP